MNNQRPLLAITMGDPAGCGPEVIAQVAASGIVRDLARIVCIGDASVMERAFRFIAQPAHVHGISDIGHAQDEPGVLDVLDLDNVDLAQLQIGQVQAGAGQAAYEYVTTGIDLALSGQVAGVVTAPLNKAALHLAGHHYDGHTEIFKLRTGAQHVTMMLAAGDFRVTHVSTHCSLRQAIERCTTTRILDVIRLTERGLRQMGIPAPRLAVAGLNPHSGEGGLFGTEESEQIQPAIDAARETGFDVYPWPVPPDTVFVRMQHGKEFDAVVAQYHDQGHIAAKLVDFLGGVNITLGLPIIRTSVDHGTAFDLAGTGQANPQSLIHAIRYAQQMAANRAQAQSWN
jgi:4-hydroxythreonine-4-phosphate dehydrogenase